MLANVDQQSLEISGGTFAYAAPEILLGYSRSTDKVRSAVYQVQGLPSDHRHVRHVGRAIWHGELSVLVQGWVPALDGMHFFHQR